MWYLYCGQYGIKSSLSCFHFISKEHNNPCGLHLHLQLHLYLHLHLHLHLEWRWNNSIKLNYLEHDWVSLNITVDNSIKLSNTSKSSFSWVWPIISIVNCSGDVFSNHEHIGIYLIIFVHKFDIVWPIT